ncbi:hypothetical protein [Streptosporangium sp. NPDC002607]
MAAGGTLIGDTPSPPGTWREWLTGITGEEREQLRRQLDDEF